MIITVKRSGGYAGITETLVDVDTAKVDAAAAQEVKAIVDNAGLFDHPPVSPVGPGADMQVYEITVSDHGLTNTLSFSEGPSDAQALIDVVKKLQDVKTA